MGEVRHGEIVDITIKGAQVLAEDTTEEGFRFLDFVHGDINSRSQIYLGDAQVTVKRVAPAEWPPLVDDLWRDWRGLVWFCATSREIGRIVLMLSNGHERLPDAVNSEFGPLTLVHREEATTP